MMIIPDSARLSYSLMNQNDGALLFDLDQDPEVMRFINGGKTTSREDIDQIYLPRLKSYTNPEAGWGMWKVVVKSSQDFIGWILVRPMDFFGTAPKLDNLELGWRFKQSSWGKGFATEAALSVKQALIAQGGLTALTGIALPDNQTSINIMVKLGMSFEKQALQSGPLGDNQVVYYRLSLT